MAVADDRSEVVPDDLVADIAAAEAREAGDAAGPPAGTGDAAGPSGPGPATRRAARNAAAVAVAEVAGKVATLAYTVAAARTLGPSDFGLFAYAVSFSMLVATLPSWGFDPLLVQRGSAEPKRLPALLSETLAWRTAISVPVFVAAGIAGVALRPGARSTATLLLVLAASMVDVYGDAGRSAAAARQRQVGVSLALVAQRLVTACLAIGALVAGFGLVGLAVSYLAGSLVGLVAVTRTIRGLGVRLTTRGVTRQGLLLTGKLSLAIGVDAVLSLALFRIDQVMLAVMKGNEATGIYAASYRLLETVLFLSWAVSRAVLPSMAASSDPARVRRGLEQGVAALAILYVPFGVGLWVEARPVLHLLYGADYAAAGTAAARWLAASPILFAVAYLGSYGLLARNRRWRIVVSTVAATAFNVGLNLVLIPHLAGTGAAIATTTAYGLEAAVTLVLLVPDIGWARLDRALALPAAAAAVMAAVLVMVHAGVALEVPLGVAVYAAAWFLLARRWARDHLDVMRSVIPWRR